MERHDHLNLPPAGRLSEGPRDGSFKARPNRSFTARQKRPAGQLLQRGLVEAIVALGAVLFLLPILFLFVTAFKPDAEIIQFQSVVPHHVTLANFRQILSNPEEIPIFRWFANSVFIS